VCGRNIYRRRIARCAPTLKLQTFRLIDEGWDSLVVIVDETWVFRFPRNAEAAAQLAIEQALLPQLALRLPLAIPNFTYACTAVDEWPFVGYRMIVGMPLRPSVLQAVPAAVRTTVAQQMAAFLQALHTFPVETARRAAPELRRFSRAVFAQEYAVIEQVIFPLLNPDEREWIAVLFAGAADDVLWDFEPAIVHNDLSSSHILFDPNARRVAGVIDFGDIMLGDPAIDFVGLLEHGEAFVEAVLRSYARPLDDGFQRRLAFYYPRAWLIELRYHLEHANAERATSILTHLHELIAASIE
jgi:aminoglycoside 2''-phosphotransferase